jgi:hypothetical protein
MLGDIFICSWIRICRQFETYNHEKLQDPFKIQANIYYLLPTPSEATAHMFLKFEGPCVSDMCSLLYTFFRVGQSKILPF